MEDKHVQDIFNLENVLIKDFLFFSERFGMYSRENWKDLQIIQELLHRTEDWVQSIHYNNKVVYFF